MKKFMSIIAIAFCLISVKSIAIQPEESKIEEKQIVITAEHKAIIMNLFEVTGYLGELEQMREDLMNRVYLMIPDMQVKDWDKIKSEVTLDTLLDQQIYAYGSKFTIDEIKELIKIFSTDVYKKMKKYGELLSETLYGNENIYFTELKYVLGAKIDKKGYEVPDYLKKEPVQNEDENAK